VFKGLGVGSWLNLEHFMMGVPGWDHDLRNILDNHCNRFMDRFTQAFFSIEDARYLRSLGINLIRVPVNHHLFWDDVTDTPKKYGLLQLQRLATICEKSGLYFLPDLHTTPGGQNPDWHSESRLGTAQFWEFAALRARAVKIWRRIAHALKDSPALLGYDLLNEPVLPDGRTDLLNAFYSDAIESIREEDKHHIVFLEGDHFSMDFSKIDPLGDENWAYTYHFYPGVWDEKLLDPAMEESARKQAFEAALGNILATMTGYSGPLLCGEMGYELSCLEPSFGIWLTETTIRAMEDKQSGWCLWCYKDARFMGLTYPDKNSGWMQLCLAVKVNWDHHRASKLGQNAVDAIESLCPYSLTDDEKYKMQFVIRAMAAKADVVHILDPALEAMDIAQLSSLPEDFLYSRCEKNLLLEALLKNSCSQ